MERVYVVNSNLADAVCPCCGSRKVNLVATTLADNQEDTAYYCECTECKYHSPSQSSPALAKIIWLEIPEEGGRW